MGIRALEYTANGFIFSLGAISGIHFLLPKKKSQFFFLFWLNLRRCLDPQNSIALHVFFPLNLQRRKQLISIALVVMLPKYMNPLFTFA